MFIWRVRLRDRGLRLFVLLDVLLELLCIYIGYICVCTLFPNCTIMGYDFLNTFIQYLVYINTLAKGGLI
jgi:hypothetical protein